LAVSDLIDFPDECGFCGKPRGDGRDFHVSFAVDLEGDTHKRALCNDCIRVHIMSFAHTNREKFEEFVIEAREWKPD
jgi:hypothetical protein